MPILQIRLTAPTGDVTKAMRQLRADESKAFTITQRQQAQMLLTEQRVAKARNSAANEALKGLKEVARARDIDAAALLKQARAQDVAVRQQERARAAAQRAARAASSGGVSVSNRGGSGIGSFIAGSVATVASQQTLSLINQTREAYTDYIETVNKSGVVFGKNAADVQAWAKTSAEAFGLSEKSALDAAGTFGNLFEGFKLGDTNGAIMSKRLVQLAADLASFNNTSVQDAIDALKSGIVGETQPLEKYGIVLREEILKNEAKRIGLIKDTKGVLDPTIKAQAAYSLILQQTSKQQGDFARTSGEAANKTRIVQAQIENLQVKLGKELAPAYASVLKVAGELTETLNKVTPEQIELLKQIATPLLIVGGAAAGLVATANGITAISGAMKALSISGPAGLLILGGLITAAALLNKMNADSDRKIKAAGRPAYLDFEDKIRANRSRIGDINAFAKNRQGTAMPGANSEYLASQGAFLNPTEQAEVDKLSRENSRLLRMAGSGRAAARKGSKAYNTPDKVNLTGNVITPVIPKGSGDTKRDRAAEAAAKRAAKDAAAALVEAAERSRNSYAIAFDEALAGGGTSGELYRLSNTLKAQDVNVAGAKRKAAGGTKAGQQDYLSNLAKARQEAIERGRKIEAAITDAREDTLKATLKDAQTQTEIANKNRENQIEFLKLEHDRLEYTAEDAKVTGNLTKQKEALQQLYDNELATLRAQYALDIRTGTPVSVAQARLNVGTLGATRGFTAGSDELRNEGIFQTFTNFGRGFNAPLQDANKTPLQYQKNNVAVSETLRQVFADAGSAAGPEFFKGLLSGNGNDALNAFRTLGATVGDGIARKLTEALIDRPMQKVFDDIANKIATGGKIAGMNLYQGAAAIYSAAQALAAARSGNSKGLIGGIIGAAAGFFIPGVGPVAGFGIGSSLASGDVIGAGLNFLGTSYGGSLIRTPGSGINVSTSNGANSAESGNGGTPTKRSQELPGGVNVVYNMYGDVNDRQDAERARRGRVNELRDAMAMA